MNSLARRLQAALAACLLAFAAVLWFAGNRVIDGLVEDLVAARLTHEAEALLAALEFDAAGAPRLRRAAPVFEQPFSGHYYVLLVGGGGELASRSLWDERLAVEPPGTGGGLLQEMEGPRGQRLLVRSAGYRKAGRDVTVALAEDLTPVEAHRARFRWAVALLALAGLASLALSQHAVLRVSLAPLTRVAEDVRALEEGRAERLPEAVPDEILPLVREINGLLASLAVRLKRSRKGLGNLAHALKLPLHLLLDDLGRNPPDAERVADARVQARRLQTLIERELRRARLAGARGGGRRFVPATDIEDLRLTLMQMHRDRGIAIETRISSDAAIAGELEDMLELLGNLLDNACKWARGRVRLTIAGGAGLDLVVEDDGPGVPPERIPELAGRGARLDESRPGHGLGLAIVHDIVAAYAGTVGFDRSPDLGGLRVHLTLPGR